MNTKVAPFKRVGFVSTRIAGTDGVSLEIEKWARVIERDLGIECYYIAGECDRSADRSAVIKEAHFKHPTIFDITQRAFYSERRTRNLTDDILDMSRMIGHRLVQAIEDMRLDAIIAENALTIPMNLPLGVAIVMRLQELQIPCLAHHHDFYWERERFLVSAVEDFVKYAFPPPLPNFLHVVINSLAGEEFSRRTGLSCRIIPNVMDFENPPEPPDDYARSFRDAVGVKEGEILVLQPTRVVPRKGIEHTLELARAIGPGGVKVVITHASGDEGYEYAMRIRDYAELLGVELIFADDRIAQTRGQDEQGRSLFTVGDAYGAADLVAYPSGYEGFGNAFLEALYYRQPVVCNRYSIFRTDIEPLGFRNIAFEGYLTRETVTQVERVLADPTYREDLVEHNYRVATQFFSYQVLREELSFMLRRPQNIYRLVGRGLRAVSGRSNHE